MLGSEHCLPSGAIEQPVGALLHLRRFHRGEGLPIVLEGLKLLLGTGLAIAEEIRTHGYSPTKEPSGATMKLSDMGEKARQPPSSINTMTRRF
jgi:hypothetical protein